MTKHFVFLFFLLASICEANDLFVFGVNVFTGHVINDKIDDRYAFYKQGTNDTPQGLIELEKEDFPIGKVKKIHVTQFSDVYFIYKPGITYVYETPERLTIYRYHSNSLLYAIEHHQKDSLGTFKPYRMERLFWQNALITTRTLEDEKGEIVRCHSFYYDENRQLIKETVFGNLSGDCKITSKIGENGYPENNGVESYSVNFIENPLNESNSLLSKSFIDNSIKDLEKANGKIESTAYEKYNEQGHLVTTVDNHGTVINNSYDAFGRLIATQYPLVLDAWNKPYHPTTTLKYDVCDQLIQMRDASGEITNFIYNARGQPLRVEYPDGSYESFRYLLDGGLKEKKFRDGFTISFFRDNEKRVTRSEKHSSSGTLLQSLYYTYQGEQVTSVSDGKSFTTHFIYDESGIQVEILQETKEGSRRLDSSFNSEYTTIKMDQCGAQPCLAKEYNVNPKKTSSDFTMKQASVFENSLGQYVKQEEKVDGYGIHYVFIYDALNRLENLTKYNATGIKFAETDFRYDAQGNKVLEKHHVIARGQPSNTYSIQWIYDSCQRLLSIEERGQDKNKITRYQYDAFGRLKHLIKPDGVIISYTYYDSGQIKIFEANDHSFAYQYEYDDLQRLVAIHDLHHQSTQTRKYNAFHDLIEEQLSSGIIINHHYDLSGKQVELVLPDHSKISYDYQGSLLSAVKRYGKDGQLLYRHAFSYNEQGLLQSSQLPYGIGSIEYQYDSKGRRISIDSPWSKQNVKDDDDLDSYRHFLRMTTQSKGENQHTLRFDYSEDGQLSEEKGFQYQYDSLFNRVNQNGHEWKVNSINQLVETPFATYKYDANGNLIEKHSQKEVIFYHYDALNRLIKIEYPQKQLFEFVYDAFDRRIEEHVYQWSETQKNWHSHSSDRYVYDGFKEIGKINSDGELVELKVLGQNTGSDIGTAIALELQGKIFIPIEDLSGSIKCLIDNQGNLQETYDFTAYGYESFRDAHGNAIDHSSVGNPWRFCSKRTDNTGLIFFGKRYYDSSVGRWLTPDPLFFCDTPNLYAFAKNDPLNHVDHFGLFSISKISDPIFNLIYGMFYHLQLAAHNFKIKMNDEFNFPPIIGETFEKIGKRLLGESTYLLIGPHFEETRADCHGKFEISHKVRVTFINGILTTRLMLLSNLETISQSHGGVKIHYVYRPTEGWTWDISRAVLIKTAYNWGGFRSMHAHLLAQMWRELIADMGGTEGGGTIIHYAHSLGGSETDRARELLTQDEQKMIRVFTFGSPTLVRNQGFQSVINILSFNDGVGTALDPLGITRNLLDPDRNVRFHGSIFSFPIWPTDHLLNGPTYGPILEEFGQEFVKEFVK